MRWRSRTGRKGVEVIEFGLVLIPMLGFTLLIMDIAWAIFGRGLLQNAVREGVRYAVTSQTQTGMGQKDSVKSVVQDNALGLLADSAGYDMIQVRFYTPDTFTDVSNVAGANSGGNLVEVSVEGYPWLPLLPLLRSAGFTFTARSSDRMEASPPAGAPPL